MIFYKILCHQNSSFQVNEFVAFAGARIKMQFIYDICIKINKYETLDAILASKFQIEFAKNH